MSKLLWFIIGIQLGLFLNSDIGAKLGYKAGKWTRELFINKKTN